MTPQTAAAHAQSAPHAREELIAVWPDETWCAYADIAKMRRDNDYQLMRVTRRGKDGAPLGFERVNN
jgi:hypothetical protein